MDATHVRRWIAGFEAATEADRQALRRRGADAAWSIRLSLSMIAAARSALGPRLVTDPLREAEAERVRSVGALLRRRLTDMGHLATGAPKPPDARGALAKPWRPSRYSARLIAVSEARSPEFLDALRALPWSGC